MSESMESADLGLWRDMDAPDQPLRRRFGAACASAASAVRANADTLIFPGAALLAYNVAFYSGLSSFSLRQTQGNRFPIIACLMCLGVVAGELVLPLFLRWNQTSPRIRQGLRALFAAYLLANAAIIAQGPQVYIYNEPLRQLNNFTLGMVFPFVFHLYFAHFPIQYRGLWYGITTALGVLIWRTLMQVAARIPFMDNGLHHPFQEYIFFIHGGGAVLMGVFLVLGLCRQSGVRLSFAQPVPQPQMRREKRRTLIAVILCAAFLMYLMNGLLQVKLFPMIPMRPGLQTDALVGVMAVVCAPLAGRMLDQNNGRGLVRILFCCSWFFILAPVILIVGDTSWLHTLVQALGVGGWFLCNIAFAVFLSGLAGTRLGAGRGASIIFAMWLAAIIGVGLSGYFVRFEAGAMVAMAVGLMLVFQYLVMRIKTLLAHMPETSAVDSALRMPSPLLPAFLEKGAGCIRSLRTGSIAAVVVPGGALFMYNVAMYSAMTSFMLRPDQEKRLLPIFTLAFSGIGVGALLFPRLYEWATQGKTRAARLFGKSAISCYLFMALATVIPGFFHYAFNEPLRHGANFCMGMVISPALYLHFSRFPVRWRGMCFGLCTGAGVLVWRILLHVAGAYPPDAAGGAHPLLPYVFTTHVAGLAGLAAFCFYGFALQAKLPPQPTETRRAAISGTNPIPTLLLATFVLCLMNSLVDVRLFPMAPHPGLAYMLYGLIIVCSPLAGWLMDRKPAVVARRIMPVCCGLFILSPAMAVLGVGHGVHDILQTASAGGQFLAYIVIALALAGLAQNAFQSAFFVSVMYSMWLVPVVGYSLVRRSLGLDADATVLMSAVLAVFFYFLMKWVDFAKEVPASAAAPVVCSEEEPPLAVPAVVVAPPPDFLSAVSLTPREREAAELLLRRLSTQELAGVMGISENTAKKHIQSVLRKFGANDRHDFYLRYITASRLTDQKDDARQQNEESHG